MFDLNMGNFLDMSPEMWGAYGLVGGVGIACIGVGILERKLYGGSFGFVYDWLNIALKIMMPATYFTFLLRFIFAL